VTRANVRQAVAAGFAAVQGLSTVDTSQKKLVPASAFFKTDGDHSGTYAFVFIEREYEKRRTVGQGYKEIVYDVGLVCQYRHNGMDPSDTEDAGVQAMDEWDATVENVKQYVRAHPTFNGSVWLAGEGEIKQGDDIEIVSDLPITDDDGYIHIWSVVRFKVIEWVQP
jgi:hypothetical protein